MFLNFFHAVKSTALLANQVAQEQPVCLLCSNEPQGNKKAKWWLSSRAPTPLLSLPNNSCFQSLEWGEEQRGSEVSDNQTLKKKTGQCRGESWESWTPVRVYRFLKISGCHWDVVDHQDQSLVSNSRGRFCCSQAESLKEQDVGWAGVWLRLIESEVEEGKPTSPYWDWGVVNTCVGSSFVLRGPETAAACRGRESFRLCTTPTPSRRS